MVNTSGILFTKLKLYVTNIFIYTENVTESDKRILNKQFVIQNAHAKYKNIFLKSISQNIENK